MIRTLSDEGVPRNLAKPLKGAEVAIETFRNEWKQLSDGDLLDETIRRGFEILLTCDKRMPYQQSLTNRDIAVLVLPTNRLPDLVPIVPRIAEALAALPRGKFTIMNAAGTPGEASAHMQRTRP